MSLALIALMVLCLYLSGCTSPETTRTRGGGPGADVGNRTKNVQMHEGSRPFYKTPEIIPPLATANQADQLSRK